MNAPRTPRLAWVAAALAVVALAGCTASSSPGAVDGGEQRFVEATGSTGVIAPSDRLRAPRLRGERLDGGQLDVSSLAGDVVVVNFWGSWCAPCRAEAPELQAVHAQTSAEGVRFVGINMRDDRTAARQFVQGKGLTFPSIYDRPGRNAARLAGILPPSTFPSTLVLDRDQRIAARFLGQVDAGQLTTALVAVLREAA